MFESKHTAETAQFFIDFAKDSAAKTNGRIAAKLTAGGILSWSDNEELMQSQASMVIAGRLEHTVKVILDRTGDTEAAFTEAAFTEAIREMSREASRVLLRPRLTSQSTSVVSNLMDAYLAEAYGKFMDGQAF